MNQPLPPMPPRIAHLPRDHRGFPIPWFVATLPDGSRDFRVASEEAKLRAFKFGYCWVCGEVTGKHKAFVIGPMCVVNRVTSEPACHLDCAMFSARACPFLTRPRMRRNDNDLPEGTTNAPGVAIMRNPGCVAVYVTKSFTLFRATGGLLVRLGDPSAVHWYAQGRLATRHEVETSINTGCPALYEMAEKDGADAVAALKRQLRVAEALLPC